MNDYASINVGPGTLLIARPAIEDPYFARSVVLVLAHSDSDGSMGVILNRPLEVDHIDPDSPIARWMESSTTPSTIFFGGPVEPDGYICLTPLTSSANAVTSIDIETTSPVHIEGPHRVFRGYSGWSAQQLSDEIRNEGWFVVPSFAEDHFTSSPETLWNRVLARQVGELSRYGQFPTDPHQN